MSLRDIMSGAGLALYAEIALVVSFIAFAGVVIWAMSRPRQEMEERARQAVEDDDRA